MQKKCLNCDRLRPFVSGDHCTNCNRRTYKLVGEWENPRFVWNIGAIKELYADMPEQSAGLVLWDRQEQKPVVTVASAYANALCLEVTQPQGAPFTGLETWFNSLEDIALTSEGITHTKPEFRA